MDHIKELEERSNSFLDENEEEKILAEVNRRYQNQVGQAAHNSGISSGIGGGGGMQSTE